jgi:tetratricopeptide (TPR) repeat protein
MSRIYFYSNETLPIMYTVLRFLNEAEKAGTSPELATAYSSMGVLAGFAQLHNLADDYVNRGLETSAQVNNPASTITVNVVSSVYKITVGKWDEVTARTREAIEICEQLGDYRQWGDAIVLLGESELISGDTPGAAKIYIEFLEDARRRRNPLHQSWALFGIGATSIRTGEAEKAIPALEEALEILQTQPNLASSINMNGQLALAHLCTGNSEKALSFANSVLELADNLRPTVYSLDVGISAVATVYFDLWESALQNPEKVKYVDEYKNLAGRALKILEAFKNVFPIGQPYLAYFQGRHAWLTGALPAALKFWQRGLDASEKYNLKYEEGLIRVKLGSYLDDPAMRPKHLEKAIGIFEKMGAMRDLAITQKIMEVNS